MMKALMVLIFFLALPFTANAKSLCDQASEKLTYELQQFDGTKEAKKSLVQAYHHSKTSLEQLCNHEKVSQVKTKVAQLLKKESKKIVLGQNTYRPRKTVEIDTIYSPYARRPASR